eukprot:m.45953 g.45953  ORF g.45953 m.45953 type:complete len:937 (+) comp8701_c0_seq1:353-3163(+)
MSERAVRSAGEGSAAAAASPSTTLLRGGASRAWLRLLVAALIACQVGSGDAACDIAPDNNGRVAIPGGTTSIQDDAFLRCTALRTLVLPNSLATIGFDAFNGCTNLVSIERAGSTPTGMGGDGGSGSRVNALPDSVLRIRGSSFMETGLPSIVIPNSVTLVGDDAFLSCPSLTNVTLGNSVATIGNSAFFNCTSLRNIAIPDSATSVRGSAFGRCSSLRTILVGRQVPQLDNSFCFNCNALTSVTIQPTSVLTRIGRSAFENCGALTAIALPDTLQSIDNAAFDDVGLTSLRIPDSVTALGTAILFRAASLTTVTIGNGVTLIPTSTFEQCGSLASVVFPSGLTSIAGGVFEGCSALGTASLPDTLASIGASAFERCSSLNGLDIPDSVTSIGVNAFAVASSLTTVSIPASAAAIGNDAFVDTPCSQSLYVAGATLCNCLAGSCGPTAAPTAVPTFAPTSAPSLPTATPTAAPIAAPTIAPSLTPSIAPTESPTQDSVGPTAGSVGPTTAPTSPPVAAVSVPTAAVSPSPTASPTAAPTSTPSPSAAPTQPPTGPPTPPQSTPGPTVSPTTASVAAVVQGEADASVVIVVGAVIGGVCLVFAAAAAFVSYHRGKRQADPDPRPAGDTDTLTSVTAPVTHTFRQQGVAGRRASLRALHRYSTVDDTQLGYADPDGLYETPPQTPIVTLGRGGVTTNAGVTPIPARSGPPQPEYAEGPGYLAPTLRAGANVGGAGGNATLLDQERYVVTHQHDPSNPHTPTPVSYAEPQARATPDGRYEYGVGAVSMVTGESAVGIGGEYAAVEHAQDEEIESPEDPDLDPRYVVSPTPSGISAEAVSLSGAAAATASSASENGEGAPPDDCGRGSSDQGASDPPYMFHDAAAAVASAPGVVEDESALAEEDGPVARLQSLEYEMAHTAESGRPMSINPVLSAVTLDL